MILRSTLVNNPGERWGSARVGAICEPVIAYACRGLIGFASWMRLIPPLCPTPTPRWQMLRGAVGQIEFARRYSLELLDATPRERWYEIPDGLTTNIAWQVGHITVSQYGLLLFRIRGRVPDDLSLIPGKFRKAYSRESTPSSDPASQPSSDELLARMSDVYDLALLELASVTTEVLLEPVDLPYAAYPIKLGAILFCPLHEHIHAGQIGVLRRSVRLATCPLKRIPARSCPRDPNCSATHHRSR